MKDVYRKNADKADSRPGQCENDKISAQKQT